MRLALFVVCCLTGSAVSAFAHSVPLSIQLASVTQLKSHPVQLTPVQPAEQSTVKSPTPPVEQSVAKSAEQPLARPTERTAKPAEPDEQSTVVKPVEKKSAKAEATCPGHPDALGTSRVITIAPSQYELIGTIQYKQTLPLKDHEVVLTFDDGPIPPYSNSILDTLADNCVKATYFLVGEMAHAHPYLVRRIYNEGHSIGTHSQHHPFAFERLSMARVVSEVDGGIVSVDTALGEPRAVSPFFRIPGFGRSKAIERFLENKGLITWSADIDTDDWWRGTTPGALVERAMRRLNAKGRGIILMHDIHPATALALPALLKALKASGYHVVHVVAAGEHPTELPEVAATPLEKEVWPRMLHAQAETTSVAMSPLHHRVRHVVASRHHYHAARRTSVRRGVASPM
jgi:peptidoglycan/xylan/chitin deacetylase (PgdA/CDA1 family)